MSESLARAFSFRRAWGAVANKYGELGHRLNHCDCLLLALIIELDGVSCLIVDDDLSAIFAETIAATEYASRVAVRSRGAGSGDGLTVAGFSSSPDHSGLAILYGVPTTIYVDDVQRFEPGRFLAPFAFLSPVLWGARLAWSGSTAEEAQLSAKQLSLLTLLKSDWLDPLFLYEVVQGPSGRADHQEPIQAQELVDRIAELEKQVQDLELSGLVRHEALIGDAARRRRYES